MQFLAEKLTAISPQQTWSEIALVYMDDATIQQTNQQFFDKTKPTDVISFTYPPSPGEGTSYTGEILVNVQRAVQEGPRHNNKDYELAFYIAHGFLHLSGADDTTPDARASMHKQQHQWLNEAISRDSLNSLFDDN